MKQADGVCLVNEIIYTPTRS